MYRKISYDELINLYGGKRKKKLACSTGDAIAEGASGAITGIMGGLYGAAGGAIVGVSQCVADNFHGIN